MTFEHVKSNSGPAEASETRGTVAAGSVTLRAEPASRGLRQWLRLLVLRRYADAMLKRTLHRHKRSRLDELSPYLLRDIGLPPDARS